MLQSCSAADNSAVWTLREVSLTDYIGEAISIRYRAIQGSSWSVDSWLIDDVQIAVDAPAATATPTPTGTGTATTTATATPTASVTPTPSSTPEPSATVEATQTPTPTVETTNTFTPTPSPTPEHTPTPTPTPTLTHTPTPTALAANSSMGSVALAAIVMQPVAPIPAPAAQAGEVVSRTIDYSYDPLYRLTAADYDDGSYFHYSYDAVGNRLSEGTNESSSAYAYDAANRLIDVDGVAYTWDANGNLLSDGSSSYSYNTANRLVGVSQGGDAYNFAYNGLGDRLQQVVNGVTTSYTLDLNTGLTQVLADGTNAYLYGLGRIGELQPDGWMYHLPDALGSVRQLSGPDAVLTQAQSYAPFGDILASAGSGQSVFQYAGEARDGTGLTFLRARYIDNGVGRFITQDVWDGDPYMPMSYNKWVYVINNPLNLVDPSGEIYNRYVAVAAALTHDLMDPFPAKGYDWRETGSDCASFASYVLWEGRVRDKLSRSPRFVGLDGDNRRKYVGFSDPPYWNGYWAQSDEPFWTYKNIDFSSWIKPWFLFRFLTEVKGFKSKNFRVDENLQENLRSPGFDFDIGDLVFWDLRGPLDGHVAVITRLWAPQTSFTRFIPGSATTWTDYLKAPEPDREITIEEQMRIFKGEVFDIWRDSRCQSIGLPYLPRVVERSGGILYHGSRSINNTAQSYPSFTIVHIGED